MALTRLAVAALPVAVLVAFGQVPAACGPACPASERVVSTGRLRIEGNVRIYETSPIEGPFLPFEGATMLRIKHGLGVVPDLVDVRLSFSERPFDPLGGGNSKPAGNQVVFHRQDQDEIAVKNDSCASYWIWIRAIAYGSPDGGADAAETAGADADAAADGATDGATDGTIDGAADG